MFPIQQGEPSSGNLVLGHTAKFLRHTFILNGGTQSFVILLRQRNKNNSFIQMEVEPTTAVYRIRATTPRDDILI